MASASPELGPAELLVVSGAGACVCQSLVAPLERVQLVRQGQGELARRGLAAPYTGAAHCAASLLRTEGVAALWRGNMASLLRIFPSTAFSFGLKDNIRNLFTTTDDAPRALKVGLNLASGGLVGVVSLLLVYPLDYARTRLATDIKDGAGGRQFRGMVDVYVKTVKADGVLGLYRGFLVAGLGIFLYRGLYFGLYDTLQPAVVGGAGGVARLARTFLLGWAVTLAAGLLVYPLDTVRTRMMMTAAGGAEYRGALHCLRYILRAEGAAALLRGAGVNILRGVAGGGLLAGFDRFQQMYIAFRTGEH